MMLTTAHIGVPVRIVDWAYRGTFTPTSFNGSWVDGMLCNGEATGYYADQMDWELVDAGCSHSFPNTGMRKSWCRHCGVAAVMDGFEWKVVANG